MVHCTYTEKRLDLCKKHGVKMMLDLLAPDVHHVYKSADKARAVCEKLRGNPNVWGYNIWNDRFAKSGERRRRDINTVRGWDPTHPAYSGTYRTEGMGHLVNADILGYYDFHWNRGRDQHFPHLMAYLNCARSEMPGTTLGWPPARANRARATTTAAFGRRIPASPAG